MSAELPSRAGLIQGRVDLDGRLISADPQLERLQIEAGGAIGGVIAIPQLAALSQLALRSGTAITRSVRTATEDSDIELSARLVPDGDGLALGLFDWFEQPRSSDSLAVEEARRRDLVEAQEGESWQTDALLRLLHCARPGLDGAELVGRPLTGLLDLSPDEYGVMALMDGVAARKPFSGQAARIRASETPVLLSGFPLFNGDGSLAGFRGKLSDVPVLSAPEPKRAEENPQNAFTQAFIVRLDRALRRPLGRIIANADTISGQLQGPLRQDYANYAADIAVAGRHLMELVDDLSDLQAIDRPDFAAAREAVDLADIGRRAAGLLRVRAADRAIRIDAPRIDETLSATGEFRRALQIMVNLIGNAIRYSPEDSMVWVRAERAGERALLIVADQGRGIAAEDQGRIFEKFERLGADESGGSGLGLYIARRLARAMAGDIDVESAPGHGSRFTFWLPAGTP